MRRLSDSELAAVMGCAPRPFDGIADTALLVFERLRYARADQWESFKRVARALEPGVCQLVEKRDGLLVVKVALWHAPDSWATEGPPRWLFVAAQRRMAEAGVESCRTAVLIAGGILKLGSMHADAAFQAELREAEQAFLCAVETGEQPDVMDEADDAVMRRLWVCQAGPVKMLGPEVGRLWRLIVELRKKSRETSRKRKTLEARMRRLIGDAEFAILAPGKTRLAIRKWGAGTKIVELRQPAQRLRG